MNDLRQAWPLPSRPRPIVIVGAGSIVRTAHVPAYQRLRFPIAGVFDIRMDAAAALAKDFDIPRPFSSLAELADGDASKGAVFDVAVPGDQILTVLGCLPRGAAVLIQKPMGENLAEARRILDVCRERRLIAAINFQLRFSPSVLALRDLIDRGALGALTDIDVRVVDRQPWEQWSFLKGAPRLEVLYHSIHYLDTIRAIAGEPKGVLCRAVPDPRLTEFADTRSAIILDYGTALRCSLTMNHTHHHDSTERQSMMKIEGTSGSVVIGMGVNLEYPSGPPDRMSVSLGGGPWCSVALRGSWFTEAFEGPMSNLQRFVAGEDFALVSPVDDAIRTMALVEACYLSSEAPAYPIPRVV